MSSHQLRLLLIMILLVVFVIGLIVLTALNITEGTGFGVVAGGVPLLLAAFLDAIAVERRRRDPEVSALADDVRKDVGEANSGANG